VTLVEGQAEAGVGAPHQVEVGEGQGIFCPGELVFIAGIITTNQLVLFLRGPLLIVKLVEISVVEH
jgi:hypothetical protein